MKLKKVLPLIISVVILIGVTAISSIKKAETPTVFNQSSADEPNRSTQDTVEVNFDEMRGVWISYIELSMENEQDKSERAFREKFEKIAENCRGFGLNTLIVQVRPFGDALYKSEYYPWSHILTGTQGKNPGYDPLEVMCEISNNYNLNIHAWVNPYRVTLNNKPQKLSDDNPYSMDNSIGLKTETGIILDPSNEKARNLIVDGIIEIVKNYDIDGIQFDDYFYPENIGDADSESYEKYTAEMGNDSSMNIENWRKANVNMLVCETYRAIHSNSDDVVFGISPQGNIENNEKLYADVKSWCTCKGFVDYICPQIYFSTENPALTFEDSLESWCELDFCDGVNLYIGLAGYKAGTDDDEGTWSNSNDILAQEYKILEEYDKSGGFMIYSYNSIVAEKSREEMQNLRNLLH